MIIQETADLTDNNHILTLIIASIAAPLDRLQLWKLLLPIAQHMRLDPAQIADLPDAFKYEKSGKHFGKICVEF